MKKLIALTLATVMLLVLCACGGSVKNSEVSYDISEGKQIPDDAVLNITIASHASWPYQEDWKVWEYIKEAIGGTINVNAVPASDFFTKFSLVMASPDMLPDVFGFQKKPDTMSNYIEQGAFLSLDDNEEYLQDYNSFWAGVPEGEKWMIDTRKETDGKVYYAPIYGMERSTNLRAWLYRKDIFEKHNLAVPETMDELYEVSKKLKALYPDSYPFSMRSGLANFNVIGSSWKPNFHYGIYYDFENEKWSYGATEPVMREMVEYFAKLVSEQLIPPDFFTINVNSWQELVATDRGFIMPEYQTRIDFFNAIAREKNPEYTLAVMTPPYAENGTGIPMVNKYNYDPMGFAVPNTKDEQRIANAFRFVNWFYSDEGEETVSWGKEGETYEVVDGEKRYILPEADASTTQLYGFRTIGTYLRVDPECIDLSISEEQAKTTDHILEHTYPHLDPTLYMSLTTDDFNKMQENNTSIGTFVVENLQKFVIGQRPMSEWDAFQKELSELNVENVLSVYEEAYRRNK